MLSALAFLTVAGGARVPDERTLRWFPVIGAVIGGVLALVAGTAGEVWDPAVVALLVVVTDLVLTGLLHVDGLADCADGLLPHLDRDRRLAVLREPTVGAFALAVVPTVLLARWVALAGDGIEPVALIAVWAASRTGMAVVPALVPYARPQGLATPFLAGSRSWLVVWLVPVAGLLAVVHGPIGVVAGVAGTVAFAAVIGVADRRLGGFTGDVLGASAVVGETVALLALAAA